MNYCKSLSLIKRMDTLYDAMHDSCGLFYIKDLKGHHICFNDNVIETAGGKNSSEFLKNSAYEEQFPWGGYRRMYAKNDRMIHQTQKPMILTEIIKTHNQRTYIVHSDKKPFYHNGDLIGIYGISIESADPPSITHATYSEDTTFFDIKKGKPVDFTKKQRQVVYHLLQGLSPLEISHHLYLSKRTIDHHIDNIKDCHCYNSTKELLLYIRMI